MSNLEYGDLETLHPTESFNEIKTRRESNFYILKTALESEVAFNIPANRLEVSIPSGQTISSETITIIGQGASSSQILVWPFVPIGDNQTKDVFITARDGDTHTFTDVTIKSPVKNRSFEHYSCVLKKGGVDNAIEIPGSTRAAFWGELAPGDKIWYTWGTSALGQIKIIDSVDTDNNLIYLTTNISASLDDDLSADFGRSFPEDVSQADYLTYGGSWYINSTGITLLKGASTELGDRYTLNLDGVVFENTEQQVTLSMGTAIINIETATFRGGAAAFSYFAAGLAGGQTVNIFTKLTIEDSGHTILGSISTLDPTGVYGAGGYLHDSIIVNCEGTLELIDNRAASWRQYSSGYNTPNVGSNYYADIQESGSGEYCFLASNVSPTVIDNIECESEIRLRHDTTINGGDIGDIFAYGLNFGTGDRTAIFNNVIFRGEVNCDLFKNATLTDCDYYITPYTEFQVFVTAAQTGLTTISGGTIYNGGSIGTWSEGVATGTRGSNFISSWGNIAIDGLVFDDYLYMYFFDNQSPQEPYTEKDFSRVIDNVDVKAFIMWADTQSSTAGTVSKTFSGTNTIIRHSRTGGDAGKCFVQNIKGTTGTVAKSIIASKSYSIVGTLTNVLEIDFQHDYYQTSGNLSAIVATNDWENSVTSNPIYGRNIRLYAVGGDITISTFDASLRPTSNIIGTNGTVISEGNYLDLTIDRDHVFMTGTTATSKSIGTGNGVKTEFKGTLSPDTLLDPNVVVNVSVGAIDVDSDADGLFSDAAVVGIIDYWTGKYHFIFTDPVTDSATITLTYNKPNIWKNTGAWSI